MCVGVQRVCPAETSRKVYMLNKQVQHRLLFLVEGVPCHTKCKLLWPVRRELARRRLLGTGTKTPLACGRLLSLGFEGALSEVSLVPLGVLSLGPLSLELQAAPGKEGA